MSGHVGTLGYRPREDVHKTELHTYTQGAHRRTQNTDTSLPQDRRIRIVLRTGICLEGSPGHTHKIPIGTYTDFTSQARPQNTAPHKNTHKIHRWTEIHREPTYLPTHRVHGHGNTRTHMELYIE